MLALSSLSKSSRFVGVMYAGLIFFTAALFQALRGITGSQRVCVAVARRRRSSSWATSSSASRRATTCRRLVAGLAVLVLIVGSVFILSRRVRGVEIVT